MPDPPRVLVGRAGVEPATNGLKVAPSDRALLPISHLRRLPSTPAMSHVVQPTRSTLLAHSSGAETIPCVSDVRARVKRWRERLNPPPQSCQSRVSAFERCLAASASPTPLAGDRGARGRGPAQTLTCLRRIALLLALQPSRAFEKRVPPIHERDHETVHAKVPGSAVVDGGLVADGEVQVVVDRVPRVRRRRCC